MVTLQTDEALCPGLTTSTTHPVRVVPVVVTLYREEDVDRVLQLLVLFSTEEYQVS